MNLFKKKKKSYLGINYPSKDEIRHINLVFHGFHKEK